MQQRALSLVTAEVTGAAETITSALTVATIMAETIIMGTATSVAAITMAMKDLHIGIMIIIADFGMVLGTSTASVPYTVNPRGNGYRVACTVKTLKTGNRSGDGQ